MMKLSILIQALRDIQQANEKDLEVYLKYTEFNTGLQEFEVVERPVDDVLECSKGVLLGD